MGSERRDGSRIVDMSAWVGLRAGCFRALLSRVIDLESALRLWLA
jgi:hypothetical protein